MDAPESGQQLSKESRNALADLTLNREVEIRWAERDSTTAFIADVFVGDEWVNLRMVHSGRAWYDDRQLENDELGEAQDDAKEAKRGIWAMSNAVRPWEYKLDQQERESAAIARAAKKKEVASAIAAAMAREKAEDDAAEAKRNAYSFSNSVSSPGGSVSVKGHYRTSKNGKTYYVRRHTRRK